MRYVYSISCSILVSTSLIYKLTVFYCIKIQSAEYEYNEADFADYTTDLSDVDEDGSDLLNMDDLDLDNLDLDELDLYPDYNDIGGFDLTPFEKHAREVFLTYAEQVQSTIDHDADDLSADDGQKVDTVLENAAISKKDLYSMLLALDIEATEDESKALFKYLDIVSCSINDAFSFIFRCDIIYDVQKIILIHCSFY